MGDETSGEQPHQNYIEMQPTAPVYPKQDVQVIVLPLMKASFASAVSLIERRPSASASETWIPRESGDGRGTVHRATRGKRQKSWATRVRVGMGNQAGRRVQGDLDGVTRAVCIPPAGISLQHMQGAKDVACVIAYISLCHPTKYRQT